MNRRGFTMIELMIAIVLAAVVGVAIYQALVGSQRLYNMQVGRAAMNANTRAVVALLPMELRELDATDAIDSDVIYMGVDTVEYKAMRGLFFLCQPPVSGGSTGSLVLWRNPKYGLRPEIVTTFDSLVIFAEGNPANRADNLWIHANPTAVDTTGSLCPGSSGSIAVTLTNVTPSGGLAAVVNGSPVRNFEVLRLRTYATVDGNRWLGAERDEKGVGYSTIQPILGPLAASGLQLTFLDTLGVATTNRSAVARVGLRVIGQTSSDVWNAGDLRRVVDTLVTSIALRNNRR